MTNDGDGRFDTYILSWSHGFLAPRDGVKHIVVDEEYDFRAPAVVRVYYNDGRKITQVVASVEEAIEVFKEINSYVISDGESLLTEDEVPS